MASVGRVRASSAVALVCVALAGGALAACGSAVGDEAGVDSTGRLRVVASVNTWGDVVRQVGGSRVHLTSLIGDSNVDPHDYESSVRDAAAVADAALVVVNGLGYDPFVDKLLDATPRQHRVVLSVADAVHAPGPNPHLWYRPEYVDAAARVIETRLVRLDPAGADAYAANLRAFLAGEARVDATVAQIRARYAGTAVAYTEPVAAYLVRAAGLRLGVPASFARAVEDGTGPSPRDSAAFQDAIARHAVHALIFNPQAAGPAIRNLRALAERNHVPVVRMTETMPRAAANLQSWQAAQARALLEALGG